MLPTLHKYQLKNTKFPNECKSAFPLFLDTPSLLPITTLLPGGEAVLTKELLYDHKTTSKFKKEERLCIKLTKFL